MGQTASPTAGPTQTPGGSWYLADVLDSCDAKCASLGLTCKSVNDVDCVVCRDFFPTSNCISGGMDFAPGHSTNNDCYYTNDEEAFPSTCASGSSMDFQRLCNCYVVPEVGANEQVTSTYQPFESFQKLSDTAGNFCPPMGGSCLADYEALGDGGNAGIGDLDGDGIDDLAVGARQSGADYNFHGAVFIIFLRVDGTVRAHQKIADT